MTGNVCDRLRSTLRLIVAVLLLISLASCYPEFKNPLPPPPAMKADQQILGTWHRTTKTEKEQLSIFQRRSGWIDAAYIEDIDGASKDGIRVAVFEGYSAYVDKQKFLCLRFREKDFEHVPEEARETEGFPYFIVNYATPSNDKLVVRHFSEEKIKQLIKEGKLKGEIPKQQYADVTVTSSSSELAEVISREGVGTLLEQDANDALVFSRGATGSD